MPGLREQTPIRGLHIELSDSAEHGDQERAIALFRHAEHTVRHRIQLGRTGRPSPQAAAFSHPEITVLVLVERFDVLSENAVGAVALDTGAANRTEFGGGSPVPAGPDCALMIFQTCPTSLSIHLGVLCERPALPTGKPGRSPIPEPPIARPKQRLICPVGKFLALGRLPLNFLDAIEEKKPEFAAEP